MAKNSLYSILRNEKYSGVYIYNKSSSKNYDGKRNGHKLKDDDDIIRLANAVPAIISRADWEKAQELMNVRKKTTAQHKAKQIYLLSGKIICGVCGSSYCGNSRKTRTDHKHYIGYRCIKKNGKIKCSNGEVNRDMIEAVVLDKLADYIFASYNITELTKKYNAYITSKDKSKIDEQLRIKEQIKDYNKKIDNLVRLVENGGSDSILERIVTLENERNRLMALNNSTENTVDTLEESYFMQLFSKAKRLLKSGKLQTARTIINQYVDIITVNKDNIEIKFNFGLEIDTEINLKNEQNNKEPINTTDQNEHLQVQLGTITQQLNCAFDGGEGALPFGLSHSL